ncbi:MAG: hypothetical protein AB1775_14135 [Bacteroidota bacterium]
MISISRTELKLIGMYYILANTPYSLFDGLNSLGVIEKLKSECSIEYLAQYYEFLTSRSQRNEISIGLAYCILIAILTYPKNDLFDNTNKVDIARLRWGIQIEEYIHKSFSSEQFLSVSNISQTITSFNDGGSNKIMSIHRGE